MQNDKSPGNDGLTKELYETFWKKLKKIFIDSMSETRQAIIRLIEKKIKRFIQNCTPISLLNVDLKIISKALSEKLKMFCQVLFLRNKQGMLKKTYW